jgi:hypothetical protein
MRISFVFLFLLMILTSKLVLFPGLLYYHQRLGSGEQTIHPGRIVPVSYLLEVVMLTGCFFAFGFVYCSSIDTSEKLLSFGTTSLRLSYSIVVSFELVSSPFSTTPGAKVIETCQRSLPP